MTMELFKNVLNETNRELLVKLDNDEDLFFLINEPTLLFNSSCNGTYNETDNSTLVIVDDSGELFPSGNSLAHIIMSSIVVTLLMIVVVVGNMLVIIAIATEKALKNIQNWFIASLAVADFFLGLVIMPFSLANELMGYWIFGNWWCDVHSAMDVLLSTASIMNLCLISLDRYWSITQAIDYLKKRTPLRAAIMIFLVWLLSALICIPPLLGWKVDRNPQEFPKCELSQDLGYVLYSALGSFYIPSCIMVFVYIRIYFAAKARARRGIRKREKQRQVPVEKCTSFTTVAKMMPMSHIHSLAGQGSSPGGLMIPGAEQGYKTTPPRIEDDDEQVTVAVTEAVAGGSGGASNEAASTSTADKQCVATVESVIKSVEGGEEKVTTAMISIPIVTCDFASDVSLSDADPSMQENGGAVYLEAPRPNIGISSTSSVKHPLASSPLRDSTLSINGDLQRGQVVNETLEMSSSSSSGRCANAISVGIENDMVSEFDPSSSDSGVVSRCAVVKPLKMRLCQPIFGRRAASSSSAQVHGHHGSGGAGGHAKTGRAAKSKKEPEVVKIPQNHHPPKPRDPEREKRRIARKKEKRATLILGLIMGSFIACWLPFFLLYILTPLCSICNIPNSAFAIAFWLGYMNSALNPVIYTIFNKDFRRAFRRILFK